MEIKILIPEGYEIDEKNSTFECIKFVPLEKNPTCEYICKRILKKKFSTLSVIVILNGDIAQIMR